MGYPGNAGAESQFANVVPPREGGILAFALDNVSRPKDLSSLNLENDPSAPVGGKLFLLLYADVKWWFFYSSVNTGTVNEAAVDIATAAITLRPTAGIEVQPGQPACFRIDRLVDKFLIVKGAANGTMRGFVSSHAFGGP